MKRRPITMDNTKITIDQKPGCRVWLLFAGIIAALVIFGALSDRRVRRPNHWQGTLNDTCTVTRTMGTYDGQQFVVGTVLTSDESGNLIPAPPDIAPELIVAIIKADP